MDGEVREYSKIEDFSPAVLEDALAKDIRDLVAFLVAQSEKSGKPVAIHLYTDRVHFRESIRAQLQSFVPERYAKALDRFVELLEDIATPIFIPEHPGAIISAALNIGNNPIANPLTPHSPAAYADGNIDNSTLRHRTALAKDIWGIDPDLHHVPPGFLFVAQPAFEDPVDRSTMEYRVGNNPWEKRENDSTVEEEETIHTRFGGIPLEEEEKGGGLAETAIEGIVAESWLERQNRENKEFFKRRGEEERVRRGHEQNTENFARQREETNRRTEQQRLDRERTEREATGDAMVAVMRLEAALAHIRDNADAIGHGRNISLLAGLAGLIGAVHGIVGRGVGGENALARAAGAIGLAHEVTGEIRHLHEEASAEHTEKLAQEGTAEARGGRAEATSAARAETQRASAEAADLAAAQSAIAAAETELALVRAGEGAEQGFASEYPNVAALREAEARLAGISGGGPLAERIGADIARANEELSDVMQAARARRPAEAAAAEGGPTETAIPEAAERTEAGASPEALAAAAEIRVERGEVVMPEAVGAVKAEATETARQITGEGTRLEAAAAVAESAQAQAGAAPAGAEAAPAGNPETGEQETERRAPSLIREVAEERMMEQAQAEAARPVRELQPQAQEGTERAEAAGAPVAGAAGAAGAAELLEPGEQPSERRAPSIIREVAEERMMGQAQAEAARPVQEMQVTAPQRETEFTQTPEGREEAAEAAGFFAAEARPEPAAPATVAETARPTPEPEAEEQPSEREQPHILREAVEEQAMERAANEAARPVVVPQTEMQPPQVPPREPVREPEAAREELGAEALAAESAAGATEREVPGAEPSDAGTPPTEIPIAETQAQEQPSERGGHNILREAVEEHIAGTAAQSLAGPAAASAAAALASGTTETSPPETPPPEITETKPSGAAAAASETVLAKAAENAVRDDQASQQASQKVESLARDQRLMRSAAPPAEQNTAKNPPPRQSEEQPSEKTPAKENSVSSLRRDVKTKLAQKAFTPPRDDRNPQQPVETKPIARGSMPRTVKEKPIAAEPFAPVKKTQIISRRAAAKPTAKSKVDARRIPARRSTAVSSQRRQKPRAAPPRASPRAAGSAGKPPARKPAALNQAGQRRRHYDSLPKPRRPGMPDDNKFEP